MSEELKHKIYSATDCISEQTIFNYIDRALNSKEQHFVEKHLLDCELCSDALEGLTLLKNRDGIITTINHKINKRTISIPEKETKIIFFNFKTISSIAAAVALLIGTLFLLNYFVPKEMKLSTVAEFKKESTPSPPVTTSNTESTAFSDSIDLKRTESLTTKNNNQQSEFTEISSDETELKEEQKPDFYTINSKSKGEETTSNNEITTGDVIGQSDANSKVTIPVVSSIPKAGLLEKDMAKDETKKAEEKKENANYSQIAKSDAPAQKNNKDKFDADKKASDNSRSESEISGKKKAKKEIANENAAQNGGYVLPDKSTDQERLKTDKPETEKTFLTISDSIIQLKSGEPQFPGGNDSLMVFIKKNFDFSRNPINWSSAMGTKIIVEFTIDIKGNVLDPKIKQGINQELDGKAIEMVKKMPRWIPVLKPYNYTLPIHLEFK